MPFFRFATIFSAFAAAVFHVLPAQAEPRPASHCIVQIHLPATAPGPVSGRLLLFVTPAPKDKLPDEVDAAEFAPQSVTIAAQDIPSLAPGATTEMDADLQTYPAGLSGLKPGDYIVQAVLDTRHDYAYAGRASDDITSKILRFTAGAAPMTLPVLDLSETVPARDVWEQPARVPAAMREAVAAARPHTTEIHFVSQALTKFWGRPIVMRGWVLTPPSYSPTQTATLPTIYYIPGFGASIASALRPLGYVNAAMAKGDIPPMIWVFLDESSPTGTHEFADSVNNGPWGTALTTELIPYLETQYRMGARPKQRFLTGHSSGGWATLWLQTRYPAFFGGTWSTAPDPSDFHDFTGVDIYATHANAYRRPDGTAYPLVRLNGKVVATLQQVAQLEAVLGSAGGQMSSFDWVFSPRGPDGAPIPLFDRGTGNIDPAVAAYWRSNYDIANLVESNWSKLKPDLSGKIHVIVGDADTFYLDGPAHRLQQVLDKLNARAQFTFAPGRSHSDLYQTQGDKFGLMKDIARQIYATALAAKPKQ